MRTGLAPDIIDNDQYWEKRYYKMILTIKAKGGRGRRGALAPDVMVIWR